MRDLIHTFNGTKTADYGEGVLVFRDGLSVDIPYDWSLVSADGACYHLEVGRGATANDIAAAKSCIRNNYDVVRFEIHRTKTEAILSHAD